MSLDFSFPDAKERGCIIPAFYFGIQTIWANPSLLINCKHSAQGCPGSGVSVDGYIEFTQFAVSFFQLTKPILQSTSGS